MELWYKEPANYWEEALPLGNGRLGAMVWSGVEKERLSLNEDTLWSGYPNDHNIKGASSHYTKAQEMVFAGKYTEAQEYLEQSFLSKYTQGYLPMGELFLTMPHSSGFTNYRRSLNLETAVSTLSYTVDDVTYTRESFASYPDQAIIMKLTASKKASISFTAEYESQLQSTSTAEDCCLVLEGIAPSYVAPSYLKSDNPIVYEELPEKKGMQFISVASFELAGGTITNNAHSITVSNADSVIIRLCAQTSFNGPFKHPFTQGKDYKGICVKDLSLAKARDYDELFKRHSADYTKFFSRVSLNLGEDKIDLPIPERLKSWNKQEDPGKYALLFQYGRYLIISASRQGTQATNLQGIWNTHLRAPWSSNFTININTEMNYWPCEAVNLPELHEPLFDLINTLRITGKETAKEHYNARGFVSHHNSDIWGLSNPVGDMGKGNGVYAFWPMSAGWLSSHAFEHYLYSNDKDFLTNVGYPIVKDAARFFLDILVKDVDGTLIFAPSTSPENTFIKDGKRGAVAKTSTMTTAIIRQTLKNAVACCEALNTDEDFKAEALAALEKIPNYKIGSKGQLLEWSEDLEEAEPTHRHTSHLYPLHPGHDITPEETPELAEACRQTLNLRGEESTGWALAWRINLWARLKEGERAYAVLQKQLRPINAEKGSVNYMGGGGCYPNMFGGHPPFQIDSNYGVCAGIAELLLQSTQSTITLLPALPKAFENGFVTGLRARGAVTTSIYFSGGKLTSAQLISSAKEKREITVFYGKASATITLIPGEKYTLTASSFKCAAL